MTKHLLTAALLGSMALSAAAESSVVFTYANDEITSWGKSKSEKIDVAMCINNPALAGKKITSVQALINKDDGVDVISLWLSKELALENKVNAPDICSMDSPQMTEIPVTSDWTVTQLDATLPEPYVITDEPVYVGYSIDVTTNMTNAEKYPIVLSTASNPEGFYLHASKSVLKWKNYTSTLDAVAAIYVTIEGDFQPYSLGIKNIPITYAEIDKPYEVVATLANAGSEYVNSIDYTYTVGDVTKAGHVELEAPLAPSMINEYAVVLPLEAYDELGTFDAFITIDKVNGIDNVSDSAVAAFQVNVMPFVPVHRPLLEEYTGLGCGYCPRGFASLEYIKENYPDFVCVAYHSRHYADPMDCFKTSGEEPVMPNNVPGYPYAWLNRTYPGDPYYGTYSCKWDKYRMVDEMIAESQIITPWDVSVSQTWDSESLLTANISVRCLNDIEKGNFKVAYVLVQNGMSDSSWGQSNYFAGNNPGSFEIPQMEQFCKGSSKMYGLVFNDVVVYSKECYGISNSIPSDLPAGEMVELSYTIDMKDVKSYQGVNLVQNTDDMYVVAIVVDGAGKVVNCAKTKTNNEIKADGVQNISSDEDADAPVEYFNLNGIKVANPENGIFIRRQGSRTSKVAL